MKYTAIPEALAALGRQWHALNNGAKHANAKRAPHPEFWKDMMNAVVHAESALKRIRTAVRAQERKERRANCTHAPEKRQTYQDGSGICRACKLKFKAEAVHQEA